MIWSEWEPRKNSFGHSFGDTDIITIYGHDIPTRFGGIMRAMRKKESEISKEGALSILKRAEYGVLSTLGKDGVPYGVTMNFVFEGEEIFLHGAKEGHKFDNIFGNDNVCFTVVGSVTLSRIGRPPPTSPSSFLARLRSCPRRARRGISCPSSSRGSRQTGTRNDERRGPGPSRGQCDQDQDHGNDREVQEMRDGLPSRPTNLC
jgi:hypothetical protein